MNTSRCGPVRLARVDIVRQIAFVSHPGRLRTTPTVGARRQQHVAAASSPSVLQKMSRVIQEKGRDFGKLVSGTERARAKLGVLEELFVLWNLEDADDELEELEDALIMADFGPATAFKIVDQIRDKVQSGELKTGEEIRHSLKKLIVDILSGSNELQLSDQKPSVLLVVGVNGGGKTTTIGKLAYKFANEGASVMLAAGDTFRAAAGEQLDQWAKRSNADIVLAEDEKTRPDTVLYKAVAKAVEKDIDLVLCDTSGRLHTNWSLMEELTKCKKSIGKCLDGAPHETLLVLDGTTGMNMLNQAKEFNESVALSGIIVTKLDGSSRGGAVVSVVDELKLPIKMVGVGEGVEDLQPFDPVSFVDALFPEAS